MTQRCIIWFRQDLRLSDNPALAKACNLGEIIPLYIIDNQHPYPAGEASDAWLSQSLKDLNRHLNNHLLILKGDPKKIIPKLMKEENCSTIFWNRCYTPYARQRDSDLKQLLKDHKLDAHSFQASLLWEPWTIKNQQGSHYKVFTPYYKRGCLQASLPNLPLKKPDIHYAQRIKSYTNATIKIGTENKDWIKPMLANWAIGEAAAHKRLDTFIKNDLNNYQQGRDFPASNHVSKLSPYLHFGEISPNQIFHSMHALHLPEEVTECFLRELGWREFSYYLLYYYPNLTQKNLKKQFDYFPWLNDPEHLQAWQRGLTGYTLVDAGMRELWQTGFMHNRVRMVVASFLIKNLMIDWRLGEAWFWDCLVDADWASNSASWQWVAGSGADAAPFFRIFNPVTQSKRFDPDGAYIRQYIPELKNLDNKYIHDPSSAPPLVLKQAGITLGNTYPKAIVDLKSTRLRALDAYKNIK
jgi:deoxyribodipyrimidine photo-lyase